jgi:hypothetical protein
MFVKRVAKPTLAKNFEEAKIIEFQMKGCKDSQIYLLKKETKQPPRWGLLLTWSPGKQTEHNTEKDNADMESLQRMVKKLSNEIVDMKRNAGEGTSNPRSYKPFFRKNPPFKALDPPPANLNIDLGEVALDSYCNYHQEHHSERDFPQWVNVMNLLENCFLDGCSLTEQPNDHTSNTAENEVSEPPEKTTMVLWDVSHTSSFDVPTEEEEFLEILAVQTRSKAPIVQNQPTIAQAPKRPPKYSSLAQPTPPLSYGLKFQAQETTKLEYNVVEDLKKLKANILVMDLCRIPQQKYLLLQALDEDENSC